MKMKAKHWLPSVTLRHWDRVQSAHRLNELNIEVTFHENWVKMIWSGHEMEAFDLEVRGYLELKRQHDRLMPSAHISMPCNVRQVSWNSFIWYRRYGLADWRIDWRADKCIPIIPTRFAAVDLLLYNALPDVYIRTYKLTDHYLCYLHIQINNKSEFTTARILFLSKSKPREIIMYLPYPHDITHIWLNIISNEDDVMSRSYYLKCADTFWVYKVYNALYVLDDLSFLLYG